MVIYHIRFEMAYVSTIWNGRQLTTREQCSADATNARMGLSRAPAVVAAERLPLFGRGLPTLQRAR